MTPESETASPLFLEIEKRCKEANIQTERGKVVTTSTSVSKINLVVLLPAGREKRNILIKNEQMAELFLSIPFENIYGVSGYQAFCSYKDGYIEALLEFNHHQYLTWSHIYKHLKIALENNSKKELETTDDDNLDSDLNDSRIEVKSEEDRFLKTRISLGWATEIFSKLETLRRPLLIHKAEGIRLAKPITIRIEGISIATNEQAINILEKVANSLLFQIDLLADIPMYLSVEGEDSRKWRRVELNAKGDCSLKFPKNQYHSNPMALYWYASMATGMPLLQYLAYYQVVEFYFPIFSEKEAHEIIKRTLKDPLFYSNQDVNISKLINSIKPLITKGFGSERLALSATLKGCSTGSELRDFFKGNAKRLEFFKSKSKVTASKKISIDNESADIVNEVSERIYEIRCRIVHAKSSEAGEQVEAILPFSKESQNLEHDIELIKFLARKVLITSSDPFVL